MEQVSSVLVASAQSVGKVFVIGFAGFLATRIPDRTNPFLPPSSVGIVARFSFYILTIPLIYSTTAMAVSPSNLVNYWFVVSGGFVVLAISYTTATIVSLLPCFVSIRTENRSEYRALRIAATFPNIVALPILIFPSLCEYSVVYEGYVEGTSDTTRSLQDQCIAESSAMIFCYFFTWSLCFWTFGNPQLIAAAAEQAKTITPSSVSSGSENNQELVERNKNTNNNSNEYITQELISNGFDESCDYDNKIHRTDTSYNTVACNNVESNHNCTTSSSTSTNGLWNKFRSSTFYTACWQVFTSAGFVSLLLGFVTGCIPPLKKAMFEAEGSLRFLGDALETMGEASSSLNTLVVAASLVGSAVVVATTSSSSSSTEKVVPTSKTSITGTTSSEDNNNNDNIQSQSKSRIIHEVNESSSSDEDTPTKTKIEDDYYIPQNDVAEAIKYPTENPIMSDPNFGPSLYTQQGNQQGNQQQQQQQQKSVLSQKVRRMSHSFRSGLLYGLKVTNIHPDPGSDRKLLWWFILSKLLIAPTIVVCIVLALDCTSFGNATIMADVPNMAKLVVIINACLPGALIVVVLLKSDPNLSTCATAVAKVYLPSYLLSIVTQAVFTAIGLLITVPNEDDGLTFCERRV